MARNSRLAKIATVAKRNKICAELRKEVCKTFRYKFLCFIGKLLNINIRLDEAPLYNYKSDTYILKNGKLIDLTKK